MVLLFKVLFNHTWKCQFVILYCHNNECCSPFKKKDIFLFNFRKVSWIMGEEKVNGNYVILSHMLQRFKTENASFYLNITLALSGDRRGQGSRKWRLMTNSSVKCIFKKFITEWLMCWGAISYIKNVRDRPWHVCKSGTILSQEIVVRSGVESQNHLEAASAQIEAGTVNTVRHSAWCLGLLKGTCPLLLLHDQY